MAVTVCPQLHFKRSERDSQGQASTRRPDARPSSASHLPGEKQNPDGVRCGSSESQTSCPNSPIPVRGDEHLCSRSSGERTSLQRLPGGWAARAEEPPRGELSRRRPLLRTRGVCQPTASHCLHPAPHRGTRRSGFRGAAPRPLQSCPHSSPCCPTGGL